MDTVLRSVGKTLSWRVTGTAITALLTYQLTGRWELAFTLGTIDTGVKLLVFLLHERLWNHLPFGRRTPR